MGIPAWLAGIKEKRGYRSYRRMALALGIDPTVLHRWRHGQTLPSPDHCRLLAKNTGTPYNEIVLMAHGDGKGSNLTV